jgi:hypothetical protein
MCESARAFSYTECGLSSGLLLSPSCVTVHGKSTVSRFHCDRQAPDRYVHNLLSYCFSGFYNSYSTAKSVILISEGLVNETAVMRRHAASNAFHVSLSHYWQARAGSASFHPLRIACFLKDGRTGLDKVFNHQSFYVRAVDLLRVFNLQWRQTRAGTTVKERKD